LSAQRPLNRTITARLAIALSAPAFAIAAIVAAGGISAPAEAQPASQVRLVTVVSSDSNLMLQQSSSSAAALRRFSVLAEAKKPKKKHHKKKKPLTPKQIAWNIMGWFHWKAKHQFRFLNWLWTRESSWNKYATNPYSGAYGIPQAMPGSKMAACGSDWRTNAKTQIRWGMRYIRHIYGTPRAAWAHEVDDGWY